VSISCISKMSSCSIDPFSDVPEKFFIGTPGCLTARSTLPKCDDETDTSALVSSRSRQSDASPPSKVKWDMMRGMDKLNLKKMQPDIAKSRGSTPLSSVRRPPSSNPESPLPSARTWGPLHEAIALGAVIPGLPSFGVSVPHVPKLNMVLVAPASSLQNSPEVSGRAWSNSEPDSESETDCQSTTEVLPSLPFEHQLIEKLSDTREKEVGHDLLLETGSVDSEPPMGQCIISPRVYAVLTCERSASDGQGIQLRLETEIRRRAFEVYQKTGNTSPEENWMQAEQSMLKVVKGNIEPDLQYICELESALQAKNAELHAQAVRIRELEAMLCNLPAM